MRLSRFHSRIGQCRNVIMRPCARTTPSEVRAVEPYRCSICSSDGTSCCGICLTSPGSCSIIVVVVVTKLRGVPTLPFVLGVWEPSAPLWLWVCVLPPSPRGPTRVWARHLPVPLQEPSTHSVVWICGVWGGTANISFWEAEFPS